MELLKLGGILRGKGDTPVVTDVLRMGFSETALKIPYTYVS